MQVVDSGDVLPDHRADRRDATARRQAIDVNGAGATQAHAAAEFGAVVTGDIADRPEQRHVFRDIEGMVLTVEFQGNHGHARIFLVVMGSSNLPPLNRRWFTQIDSG
jgi:hypothetical protein